MIDYDLRGDAAWLTIDRPEKRNALSASAWADLSDGLDRAGEEARAAVITGAGEAFCGGNDIASFREVETVEDARAHCRRIYDGVQGIERAPVPVIAAVDGIAYGSGCEIVAACDLAVAAEGAAFALPESRVGVFPTYAVERVAVTAGRKRMMELILTGEPVDAATALDWGLVNRVTPPADLAGAVADLVDSIAAASPWALSTAKRYANDRIMEQGEFERKVGAFASFEISPETSEGVEAFFEGREPEFGG